MDPKRFLSWEDIDTLWRLNRDWIRSIPEDVSIHIDDFCKRVEDVRVKQFLYGLELQVVSKESFLRAFDQCAFNAITCMASMRKGTKFVIVANSSFDKSNTWVLLLFWHVYRTRFPGLFLDI
jgi:hypothetical protein